MRLSTGLLVIGSGLKVSAFFFGFLSQNIRTEIIATSATNPPTDTPAIAPFESAGPLFDAAAAVVAQVLEPEAQGVGALVEDWRTVATDSVEAVLLGPRLDVAVSVEPNRLTVQC